jgi:alpha-1,2-mannosyltransferase
LITWTLTGNGLVDPLGHPIGTDFLTFWTVSRALLTGNEHAVYIPAALAALEQAAMQPAKLPFFYAWSYPPPALIVVYPLGLLPYLWSLAAWVAVGLAGYIAALWRIFPRPLTIWVGLAFPAVVWTVTHGQTSFLVTGLFTWGLLLLHLRPILAGILLGLLIFKPQLGLLLPIALIAGSRWRTIVAAVFTGLAFVATTILLFGSGIWSDFLGSMPLSRAMLDEGLPGYYKLQSVFAAARLLGSPLQVAYGLQALVALSAAIIVAWAWARTADPAMKNAVLVAAAPLSTPYIYDYDLLLVAPAIAWLARKIGEGHALPWEKTILVAAFLTPFISREVGWQTHLLLAPMVVAALVAVITVRLWRT